MESDETVSIVRKNFDETTNRRKFEEIVNRGEEKVTISMTDDENKKIDRINKVVSASEKENFIENKKENLDTATTEIQSSRPPSIEENLQLSKENQPPPTSIISLDECEVVEEEEATTQQNEEEKVQKLDTTNASQDVSIMFFFFFLSFIFSFFLS